MLRVSLLQESKGAEKTNLCRTRIASTRLETRRRARRSRGRSTEQLTPDEQVEPGPFARELVVRALFGDDAVLHEDDLVRRLERREAARVSLRPSAKYPASRESGLRTGERSG